MYELPEETKMTIEATRELNNAPVNTTTNKSIRDAQIAALLGQIQKTATTKEAQGAYLNNLAETAKKYNVEINTTKKVEVVEPVKVEKPVEKPLDVDKVCAPAATKETAPKNTSAGNGVGTGTAMGLWILLEIVAFIALFCGNLYLTIGAIFVAVIICPYKPSAGSTILGLAMIDSIGRKPRHHRHYGLVYALVTHKSHRRLRHSRGLHEHKRFYR